MFVFAHGDLADVVSVRLAVPEMDDPLFADQDRTFFRSKPDAIAVAKMSMATRMIATDNMI